MGRSMADFPPPGPPQYPPSPPLAPPPSPVPPGSVPPGLWAAPPPVPGPEPGRQVAPWVVVVAVLATLGLIGGTLLAFTGGDDAPDDEQAGAFERDDQPTTTVDQGADDETTSTEAAPDELDLDAAIAEIEDFVAEERGLPFLREVTVTLLDDDEFEARLLEDFGEDEEELVTTGFVLQAVGLLEPGTDLVAALRTLLGAGVVGTYDPETDELLVRGTEVSPYVRTVIAHELVHALDDQHFELDRPELDDAPDESGFGFTALVEGNARRIDDIYRTSVLTPAEQTAADAEELAIGSDTDFTDLPLVLLEQLYAPYILGPSLVDAILDDGGQERLDAAYVTPPTTSEALFDPSAFLDGQGALPVPAPAADGEEIDRQVLGELGLAQILGEATFVLGGAGGVSAAVEGWGGDQYVAWRDGDRACLRANIVGDTPEDTAEIGEALEDFAAAPPFDVEATVEVTADLVTFTSCG
jgi:hypothetical protein